MTYPGTPPRAWGRRVICPFGRPRDRYTPTCVGTTVTPTGTDWSTPVHPHVRGDDETFLSDYAGAFGTPPRAWGRRARNRPVPSTVRYTPTCVGTTRKLRWCRWRWTVHPHVRGDDCRRHIPVGAAHGTPPRAWGRLAASCPPPRGSRYTPTCVGTTAPLTPAVPAGTVHPHVRGDDAGTRQHILQRERYTPTCVGTTSSDSPPQRPAAVHPHVRGDDSVMSSKASAPSGTPPRAWGRRRAKANRRHSDTVHPHVRGDDLAIAPEGTLSTGTPPRAWGRLSRCRRLSTCIRYTPTCVGTTIRASCMILALSVHPHVRGDDCPRRSRRDSLNGTPPRAWGRPQCHQAVAGEARYTPTCVGTT